MGKQEFDYVFVDCSPIATKFIKHAVLINLICSPVIYKGCRMSPLFYSNLGGLK